MPKLDDCYKFSLICNHVVISTQQFDAILAPLNNAEIEFSSRRDNLYEIKKHGNFKCIPVS